MVQVMAYSISGLKAFIVMEFVNVYNLDTLIFPNEELKIKLNEKTKFQ